MKKPKGTVWIKKWIKRGSYAVISSEGTKYVDVNVPLYGKNLTAYENQKLQEFINNGDMPLEVLDEPVEL